MVELDGIFKCFRWETRFEIGGKTYGGQYDATNDERVHRLNVIYPLKGKRVLELGPLEGGHTLMLHRLGCREIVSVEGRPENYVKCLLVKSLFEMANCQFVLGSFDLHGGLPWETLGQFDLCTAIGVLYHVIEPVYVLRQLSKLARNLYIWTHVASDSFPHGAVMTLHSHDGSYKGRVNFERDLSSPLAGLGRSEFWLFEEDLIRVLHDSGYGHVKVLERGSKHDPLWSYSLLLASKHGVM